MKRHLFKIVLGGFIVFLTLPLIFDGDGQEAKTKAQTSSASTAEQEQQAVLPVVQKALPFRSENVLSKYAGRFKRFYINPQETKQQISQEIQQEQNGFVYASADTADSTRASYGIPASGEDEAYAKEYFSDVPSQNAAANYGAIADAGTKQKIHDNAPVKGLYESSAVDPYEARVKAKEVYSNAMSRVDASTSPVEVDEEIPSAQAARASGKQAVYVSSSNLVQEAKAAPSTQSKYIGIASKGSSRPSSASSGSLSGGFGGGGISAKDADSSSSSTNIGGFEMAAQNVEGKVDKIAPEGGVSRSFTVVSNGKAGTAVPSKQGVPVPPQKPNTPPVNQPQPNNPSNSGNQNDTSNPSEPTQPKPDTFDPSKWISKYTLDGVFCTMAPDGSSIGSAPTTPKVDFANIGSSGQGLPKDLKTAAGENGAAWSPTCVEDSLPKIDKNIADKYQFLIIAGRKDGKYVAVGPDSFEGFLFTDIQKAKYAAMPVEKAKDGFYYIPEHTLTHKMLKDKNIIPVLPKGEDIAGVYIEPGSLKQGREAYDQMVGDIEKYSKQKAEAEAAEAKKAAEDVKQKKQEVKEATKEAVEKANGK